MIRSRGTPRSRSWVAVVWRSMPSRHPQAVVALSRLAGAGRRQVPQGLAAVALEGELVALPRAAVAPEGGGGAQVERGAPAEQAHARADVGVRQGPDAGAAVGGREQPLHAIEEALLVDGAGAALDDPEGEPEGEEEGPSGEGGQGLGARAVGGGARTRQRKAARRLKGGAQSGGRAARPPLHSQSTYDRKIGAGRGRPARARRDRDMIQEVNRTPAMPTAHPDLAQASRVHALRHGLVALGLRR